MTLQTTDRAGHGAGISTPPGQDPVGQEKPSAETAWTVLDAAYELGDTITVEACRRVIDANLRGEAPARSDITVISAFFS